MKEPGYTQNLDSIGDLKYGPVMVKVKEVGGKSGKLRAKKKIDIERNRQLRMVSNKARIVFS